MDEVEHAMVVGQQLVAAASNSSVHINRVADALLQNLEANQEPTEEAMEEESIDSDECMEGLSEKMRRYQHSELCDVSDPEAWMELHHGVSEPAESTDESEDDP